MNEISNVEVHLKTHSGNVNIYIWFSFNINKYIPFDDIYYSDNILHLSLDTVYYLIYK